MRKIKVRKYQSIRVQDLKKFYYCKQNWSNDYKHELKSKRKLGPYDWREFIYWPFKILAMPIVGSIIVILLFLIRGYRNLILSSSVLSILVLAFLLIASYIRERFRAYKYRIDNDKIKKKCFILNEINKTSLVIGLVGDIMRMKNIFRSYNLRFSQSVKHFFKDVDVIVGNLEGVISMRRGSLLKQSFQKKILFELDSLRITQSTKWLLGLSNNHSADFRLLNFNHSLFSIIRKPNFFVFGRKDVPNVVLKSRINIACASEWSNHDNWDYISKYSNKELRKYHCCCKFNILYPHWGYENERYVRKRLQKDAKALLTGEKQKYSWYQRFIRKHLKKKIRSSKFRKWDLIFGHHSHVRQPLMQVLDKKEMVKKLVVFSGGNFTSGALILRRRKHTQGIIMKCKIGPLADQPKKLAIGQVKWRNTRVQNKIKNYKTRTVYIDRKNEKTYNIYALIFIIIAWTLFIIAIVNKWF
ncbi:MAG: hypothetical protein ACFFA3_14570 [Promethearchaeota archaeon]